MKNPKVRLILSLAAMFVLGAISGVGLTMFCHPFFGPPRPGKMAEHMQNFLTERLGLTADQQEKLKPIAADFATQADKLHSDSIQQFRQLGDAIDDRVAAILTPEQKTKLDQLRKQRDDDFTKHGGGPDGWMRHTWGGSNDAGGPPGPPPNP
jgi:Spy/CpxP family protein refolding chaperone